MTSKEPDCTPIPFAWGGRRAGDAASPGRLLTMGASTGALNMGIDEALASLCRDGATLRFYAWKTPTLSIGYAQRSGEIDLAACRTSAVHLVRRPTGGRAVLHRRDLTYSLILPLRPPWTKISVSESYRLINRCLRRSLSLLGLEVSVERRPRHVDGLLALFCFSATSYDELLVGGTKVIGSAQRRFPAALLQQGSILFDFDPADMLTLLRRDERAVAADCLRTVGSLREAMGRLPDRLEVETTIREGFAEVMGVAFVEGALRPDELRLAEQLAVTRYGSDNWTFRR